MLYNDLREWLDIVTKWGQVTNIDGADPKLEMGAIVDYAIQKSGSTNALLFDNIIGHEKGFRVLVGPMNSPERLALTLHEESADEMSDLELVKQWKKRLKEVKLLPPVEVVNGPVTENVLEMDDVDLYKFPAPQWREYDGGPYMGTAGAVITKDPDSDWVNLGTYRIMVHNKNTLVPMIVPGKQGHQHMQKYFDKGKPCPVAVSFGHDPLMFYFSSVTMPQGVSEYDYIGGLRGEPVQVIKGEYTGIPVPAYSEMVVEGEFVPGDLIDEGPFGEWTGYYASGITKQPALRVKRIMYRNKPILLAAPPGQPLKNTQYYLLLVRAVRIWDDLEAIGVPEVRGVWCYQSRFITVVSIKQRYPGHARQAAMAAMSSSFANMMRYCIVVDDDIDPSDIDQVLWAIATRSDPIKDIDVIKRAWSSPLDPMLTENDSYLHSRAIIDACIPWDRKGDFPREVATPLALAKEVEEKWGGVLFGSKVVKNGEGTTKHAGLNQD